MRLFPSFLISLLIVFSGCDNRPSVQWEKFTPENFLLAQQNQQPVFADFYAAWCGPCMIMKDTTFKDPRVIEALEPFMRLKADLSFRESEYTYELSSQYQIDGLPTVIFFDYEGREIVRSHFVTASELINIINQYKSHLFPPS